jgi:hypothetical protein
MNDEQIQTKFDDVHDKVSDISGRVIKLESMDKRCQHHDQWTAALIQLQHEVKRMSGVDKWIERGLWSIIVFLTGTIVAVIKAHFNI